MKIQKNRKHVDASSNQGSVIGLIDLVPYGGNVDDYGFTID